MVENVPPPAGQEPLQPPNGYPPPPPAYPASPGYPPPGQQPVWPPASSGSVPLGKPFYDCGPGEATKRFFQNYVRFNGRASRSEFWWPFLMLGVAVVGLLVLAFAVQGVTAGFDDGDDPTIAFIAILVLAVLLMLSTFLPSISVSIRRLHDADMSGWFYLLTLIPYVGGIVMIVFGCLRPNPRGVRFDEDFIAQQWQTQYPPA